MKKEENKPAAKAVGPADGQRRKKRGIIIAFAVMAGIVLLWYAVIPGIKALSGMIKDKSDGNTPKSDYMDRVVSHTFYPSNYSEDIYADSDYMARDRRVAYTEGGDTYYIDIGSDGFADHGAPLAFFGRYFDAVIAGEYEDYDKFFTDFYLENQKNKEQFTPQKLYDIDIRLINSKAENGYTTYNYYVSFKIEKNTGTFRNDIGSNSARRVVYELVESDNGEVLINYIGIGLRREK